MAESGNKEKCNICLEVGISYNGLSNNDPNFDGWKRIVIRDACSILSMRYEKVRKGYYDRSRWWAWANDGS